MKKKSRSHGESNAYTFMFFPEGRGTPFTLRVHRYIIYMTVTSVVVILLGLAILLYKTGDIALKLQMVQDLKTENARLREHSKDLEISSQKIVGIDSMTAYLRRLASVADIKEGVSPSPSAAVAATASAVGRSDPPPAQQSAERADGQVARTGGASAEFAASVPNIMPATGWITKLFSTDKAETHLGVDIAATNGTPIRATAVGVVEDVRNDKYYGLTVEVRHENGYLTRYGHCSQVLASIGDRVNRGQTIALVGNTGRSTAPHVHYEIMKYGKNVDPMDFIGAHKQ